MSQRGFLPVAGLVVLGFACSNHSGSGNGSGSAGSGANGGGSVTLTFAGPIGAAPSAHDAVRVHWQVAENSLGDPASSMRYTVLRGTSLAMTDAVEVASLAGGESFEDTGLLDDITYFYRVVAADDRGNEVSSEELVSAHLPRIPPPPIDYQSEIDPLWATALGRDGQTACIDCHFDGAQTGYGFLSLSSWERLMIGTGSPGKPNSFVVEGESKATAKEFLARFEAATPQAPEHRLWKFSADLFLPEVRHWLDEGAHSSPDLSRPTFDFFDLQNQARYSVTEHGDGTVTVNFPHAEDPESEPYRGTINDHLEYRVYGGRNSNSIDWRNPVAVLERYNFPKSDPSYGLRFDWALPTGTFVVRAVDYTGNVTLDERELVIGD